MSAVLSKTIFVVGLGMVGIAFIEKVLNLDEQSRYRLIVCGEEFHFAYNRVALTDYFQHRSVDKLYLNKPEWYIQQNPEHFLFHVGEQVTSVNHADHTVTTDKGRIIPYDICVIATGSTATIPPYISPSGITQTRGVFVYRNIADLDSIISYADQDGVKGGRAAVVGGGLLGLEAAKAVYDLDTIADVSIINRQKYPLSRQVDSDAGEMVLHAIKALGVQVLTSVSVQDITTTQSPSGETVLSGLDLTDGTHLEASVVIFAIGCTPRDDLARESDIDCHAKGGIIVEDDLSTSAKDVYAIGECASWRGNTYGLIGPGVEMADILSFNLTQTSTSVGTFEPRRMNDPDLSTKLKLMGVDVASFGDFFADKRMPEKIKSENGRSIIEPKANGHPMLADTTNHEPSKPQSKSKHGSSRRSKEESTKCLTYRDPFANVYKKYIFTANGKYLLGGIMVGDTSDYVKLISIVKKKKALDIPPAQFILGAKKSGDDAGDDLDDDTQICSCHNVVKGAIGKCVKDGVNNLDDIKMKTKAGTGCGGCLPLVTNIFKAEMKKAGHGLSNNLCHHFNMSRADLFTVVKMKNLKTSKAIMEAAGLNKDSIGCEICKPAMASILSSIWNEPVMSLAHHHNQDTNDRFLANIQRNGTFSVVPRVAGGEITPDKLIVLGEVAKKYDLYTKITGGQRIDLFGAHKEDLPDIWEMLVRAGFESGHAYGKSLRTIKSCVGTTWCRYGVGDSVGLAIQLEQRYKGVRSPHKIKGAVSGCVRECAEAQSKDFGLIATDKGWNIFIAGNGGANPRHATLFATDVPPSKVVRIIDRFLMLYIHTADRLMRTARWIEQFEGGIEKLKKIILEDELGICVDLEREMDALVGTYSCEWTEVVNDPEKRKRFRQFVNVDERVSQIEPITERGQTRPADWPKAFPATKFSTTQVTTPKDQWQWKIVAKTTDLLLNNEGTTSAAVKYGNSLIAIFHVPKRGYYAVQQMCPHRRAFVLDHGIVSDDASGKPYVSCPLHKRNFKLDDGECLNDNNFSVLAFDVREQDGEILLLLPEADELDEVIGTNKWMIRQATAELFGRGGAGQIEIIGPDGRLTAETEGSSCGGSGCGNKNLEW